MQQLAKLIESRMRGQWKHAAVHDSALQCIWPLNDQDRERKIAEFATHYGFRLRFTEVGKCTQKGLCGSGGATVWDRKPKIGSR